MLKLSILKAGGNPDSINLNEELGNAAFFGNWKVYDFLTISDHGPGWGNSMDWKLLGDYLPE